MRSTFTSTAARLGLLLTVALATAGIAAASASAALPELEYTLPLTLKYAGGEATFERSTGEPVHCKTVGGGGEPKGPKEFTSKLEMKECTIKVAGITAKCTSAGLLAGEIVTKSMSVRLVYLSKAAHEAGLVYDYGGKNATIASFKCGGGINVALRGELIGKVTPVNTITTSLTLSVKGSKGVQELTKYENEAGQQMTASPFEEGVNESFAAGDANMTGLSIVFGSGVEVRA
jgi:hypothetical protein